MSLKGLQFMTIIFVALSMGTAFGHLLEMPVRVNYDPALWSRVTNVEGTYRWFGRVGGMFEAGAVVMTILLAVQMRAKRRVAFYFALIGAMAMVTAHAVFWVFVSPVNSQMVHWTPNSLPTGFVSLRNQWEYAHAMRAIFQIISLGAIVASALTYPSKGSSTQRA